MAATAIAPAAFDAAQTQPFPNDMSFLDGPNMEQSYNIPSTLLHQDSTNSGQDLQSGVATPQRLAMDMPDPNSINYMDPATFIPDMPDGQMLDPNAPLENQIGVMADLQSYEAEAAASPNAPMQAFAKIQFTDGDFYVNTYAVELGRDMAAMKVLRRRQRKQRLLHERGVNGTEEHGEQLDAPEGHHSSMDSQIPRPRAANAASFSNISDAGGMIGANVYSDDEEASKPSRRHKRKLLNSQGSSQSQSVAPKNLHHLGGPLSFTSQLFPEGQALQGNDFAAPRENQCPFIPIHPPGGANPGSISRKQVRIEYNPDKAVWEMLVLGRNGALHDGEHIRIGETVKLHHGSEIMLQTVQVVFKLPDNARDDYDMAESDDGDSALSSVGSSPLGGQAIPIEEDSDTSSPDPQEDTRDRPKVKLSFKKKIADAQKQAKNDKGSKSGKHPSKSGKEPAKTKVEQPEEEKMADVKPSVEQHDTEAAAKPTTTDTPSVPPADLPAGSILAGLAPEEIPQKRKGPGRPPKNGVMSKRDEAIIKRKKKELQKLGLEIPPLADLLVMARAEAGSTVKKDKPEDGAGDDDVKNSIEPHTTPTAQGSSLPANDPSASAAARPSQPSVEGDAAKARRLAKSPSPQKPESDYTEEELKKPPKTYVVLIHEAISKSQTGIMDLQQIYDAIQKMYPFYKYRSQTQGWQSSIRHNLIGSEAFEEAGKIGKGRLWKNNANFNIDKEKKRKAPTPPPENRPQYPASYYAGGQYGYNNQGYSAYGSPYGRPYGQPTTTLPAGQRPPPAHTPSRPGGAYFSPYANQPGQTHASPYGPPSRPPYAQAARPPTSQPNGAPSTATAGSPPTMTTPAQAFQPQPQQSGQAAIPQSGTPQPAQGQNSLGSEATIDAIMAYHKKFLGQYKQGAEQDAARELFRKAVGRHIDKTKDHGPYSSPGEETIFRTVSDIINTETRRAQAAASMAPNGQATAVAHASTASHSPVPALQPTVHGPNGANPPPRSPLPQGGQMGSVQQPTASENHAAQTSASHERELVQALQTAVPAPRTMPFAGASAVPAANGLPASISAAMPAPIRQTPVPVAKTAPVTAGTSKEPIDLDAVEGAASPAVPPPAPAAVPLAAAVPNVNGALKRTAEDEENDVETKKQKV